MKTTLNKIREKSPCVDGWKKLLAHLGKTAADDEPLFIETVLDSNGLGDALWCLRAVSGRDREIRLYAVWCARQVHHLMKDPRSIAALDVAEGFANGRATSEELRIAYYAADAADAAAAAADVAAAAADAAYCAAYYAADAAHYVAAAAAAYYAARKSQEARLRELCTECTKEVRP
ncbi:MAG: hypothetical protein WAV93_11435 [Bacteroidales bacterium]